MMYELSGRQVFERLPTGLLSSEDRKSERMRRSAAAHGSGDASSLLCGTVVVAIRPNHQVLKASKTMASPSSSRPGPSTSPAPVRLSNNYIRRLTSSAKPCYVCSRQSPIVLVSNTAGAHDFFYVCAGHLTDRNFASRIALQTGAAGTPKDAAADRLPDKVSKEEIEKVKREWEERQRAKKSKDSGDKKGDDDKKKEDAQQGWLAYLASSVRDGVSSSIGVGGAGTAPATPAPAPTSSTAPAPSSSPAQHEHYSLHRGFYTMRVDAFNRARNKVANDARAQGREAELMRLPSV